MHLPLDAFDVFEWPVSDIFRPYDMLCAELIAVAAYGEKAGASPRPLIAKQGLGSGPCTYAPHLFIARKGGADLIDVGQAVLASNARCVPLVHSDIGQPHSGRFLPEQGLGRCTHAPHD